MIRSIHVLPALTCKYATSFHMYSCEIICVSPWYILVMVSIWISLKDWLKSRTLVSLACTLISFHFQPFNFSHYELLEQSLPFYNMLRHHLRKSSSLLKTPLPEPDLPIPANKNLLAWVGDEILPRDDAKVLHYGKESMSCYLMISTFYSIYAPLFRFLTLSYLC